MKKLIALIALFTLSLSLSTSLMAEDELDLNLTEDSCSEKCSVQATDLCKEQPGGQADFMKFGVCFSSSFTGCVAGCVIPEISIDNLLSSNG